MFYANKHSYKKKKGTSICDERTICNLSQIMFICIMASVYIIVCHLCICVMLCMFIIMFSICLLSVAMYSFWHHFSRYIGHHLLAVFVCEDSTNNLSCSERTLHIIL